MLGTTKPRLELGVYAIRWIIGKRSGKIQLQHLVGMMLSRDENKTKSCTNMDSNYRRDICSQNKSRIASTLMTFSSSDFTDICTKSLKRDCPIVFLGDVFTILRIEKECSQDEEETGNVSNNFSSSERFG